MDLNSRVEHMDEELKLLKNEIKQVLLEIQEHILNAQNPFVGAPTVIAGAGAAPPPEQPAYQPAAGSGGGGAPTVVVDTSTTGGGGGPAPAPTGGMDNSLSEFPSAEARERNDFANTGVAAPDEEDSDLDDFEEAGFRIQSPSEAPHRGSRASGRRVKRSANNVRAAGRDYDEGYPEEPEERDEAVSRRERHASRQEDATPVSDVDIRNVTDLVTLAGLAQWSQSAIRKVGKEHLQSLLEVSQLTGRISKETRDVLLAIIPLLESNTSEDGISAKEIISLLAQLDGFLGTASPKDTKLLPFLLQDDLEVFPLIQP